MAVSKIQTANEVSSWTNDTVYAYRIGRVVYITWSTITSGVVSGYSYTLATLPEQFRPILDYHSAWNGVANNGLVSRGRFSISTSGVISWCGDTLSGPQEFTGSACYIAKNN